MTITKQKLHQININIDAFIHFTKISFPSRRRCSSQSPLSIHFLQPYLSFLWTNIKSRMGSTFIAYDVISFNSIQRRNNVSCRGGRWVYNTRARARWLAQQIERNLYLNVHRKPATLFGHKTVTRTTSRGDNRAIPFLHIKVHFTLDAFKSIQELLYLIISFFFLVSVVTRFRF